MSETAAQEAREQLREQLQKRNQRRLVARGIEPPTRLANRYAERLEKLAFESEQLLREIILAQIVQSPDVRSDAIDDARTQSAIGRYRDALNAIWLGRGIEDAARRQAADTEAWASRNLSKALNIDVSDVPVSGMASSFVDSQKKLVKDVAEDYVKRVERVLAEAPVGVRAESLTKRLMESAGAMRSRARLIAVNETLTLSAEVNKSKQRQVGIQKYMWSTAKDSRVRDHHEFLDGQIFEWGKPPVGGGTSRGSRGEPGSGIRCRCVAVAILD